MQGYDIYIFLYFLIFLLIAFMPLKIYKEIFIFYVIHVCYFENWHDGKFQLQFFRIIGQTPEHYMTNVAAEPSAAHNFVKILPQYRHYSCSIWKRKKYLKVLAVLVQVQKKIANFTETLEQFCHVMFPSPILQGSFNNRSFQSFKCGELKDF